MNITRRTQALPADSDEEGLVTPKRRRRRESKPSDESAPNIIDLSGSQAQSMPSSGGSGKRRRLRRIKEQRSPPVKRRQRGEKVKVYFNGTWCHATITSSSKRRASDKVDVKYDDEDGAFEDDVDLSRVRDRDAATEDGDLDEDSSDAIVSEEDDDKEEKEEEGEEGEERDTRGATRASEQKEEQQDDDDDDGEDADEPGEYEVDVLYDGKWYKARVRGVGKHGFKVYYDFDDTTESNVVVDRIRARTDAAIGGTEEEEEEEEEEDLDDEEEDEAGDGDRDGNASLAASQHHKYCHICETYKHKDSFSDAVKRGDYGKWMDVPYCLVHTAGDQRNWVQKLKELGERATLLSGDLELLYGNSAVAPAKQKSIEKRKTWTEKTITDADEEQAVSALGEQRFSASKFVVDSDADGRTYAEVAKTDGGQHSKFRSWVISKGKAGQLHAWQMLQFFEYCKRRYDHLE